jgi:hypothetical protein
MARAVRSIKILKGHHIFPPMPQLDDAQKTYERHLSARLKEFPLNEEERRKLIEHQFIESFQHHLRYDAESVFWLLLWWAIQAQPKSTKFKPEDIDNLYWNNLTNFSDKSDGRKHFIGPFPDSVCHSAYQPLDKLLGSMAEHLEGDHSLLSSRSHDEYLHEVFQRLILEFLASHGRAKSEFLTLEKSPQLRKVPQPDTMVQPVLTHQTTNNTSKATASRLASSQKRGRGGDDDDDYTEGNRSTKRVSHFKSIIFWKLT